MSKQGRAMFKRVLSVVMIGSLLIPNVTGLRGSGTVNASAVERDATVTEAVYVHLPFEGNVLDQSGHDINGTAVGAVTFPDGIIGIQAMDTTNAYTTLGTEEALNFGSTQDFTVSFWMKSEVQNSSGVSSYQSDTSIISNKDWNNGANTGWMLGVNGDKLQWNMKGNGTNRLDVKAAAGIVVGDNTWHHVVVSHDRDGKANFYVDNKLKTSVSIAGQGSIDSGLPTNLAADGKNKFRNKGLLEDFRIYRSALTAEDVSQLYDIRVPATGMELDKNVLTMLVGQSNQINAKLLPEDANMRKVTWTSSDKGIVDVTTKSDKLSAEIVAHKAGTATITAVAADGGYIKSTIITVKESDGLALYLPFDGDLNDASGKYPSVVTEKGTLNYGEGVFGESGLDLSNGYAALDKDQLQFGDSQDFSVAFWMKSKSSATDNEQAIVSNRDADSSELQGWQIGLNEDKLQWNWKGTNSVATDLQSVNSNVVVGDNQWHFIVITHDRDGNADIYKDSMHQASIPIGATGNIDTALGLKVGADGNGAHRYLGLLDEMQIFNNVLTPQAISSMYAQYIPVTGVSLKPTSLMLATGEKQVIEATIMPALATNRNITWTSSQPAVATVTPIPGTNTAQITAVSTGTAIIEIRTQDKGLVANATVTVGTSQLSLHEKYHLPFDGNVLDTSAFNHATSPKGTIKYTDSRIGLNAVDLSGGYVTLDDSSFKLGTSQNFSVSFWMKSGSTSDTSIISNKDWDAGSNTGWVLGINKDVLQWNFKGTSGTRADLKNTNNTIVVGDNKWHHVVVTHDRADKAKFYVDNVLKSSISITGQGNVDTSLPLTVGADGKGQYSYPGLLDELQIFDTALTDKEVSTLYKAYVAPSSVSLVPNPAAVTEGQPLTVTANILPSDTSNKVVKWSVDDQSLATIEPEANGTATLHALLPGTVNITVTTVDGALKTELPVTIGIDPTIVKVNSIVINPEQLSLKEKSNTPLMVTVLPENAKTKSLKWTSSNKDISEVVEVNGVPTVIGKLPGIATLTATSVDGSALSSSVEVTVTKDEARTDRIIRLPLDGNTNNAWADNLDPSVTGNLTYEQGILGQALHLQNKNASTASYLDFGNPLDLSFGQSVDFSIGLWMKSSGVVGNPALISNTDTASLSGAGTGWSLELSERGSAVWKYKPKSGSLQTLEANGVSDGKWHHIAVTVKRDQTMSIFVDGVLQGNVDISSNLGDIDTVFPVVVGLDGAKKLAGTKLDLTLDELSLYRKALTEAELHSMVAAVPPIVVSQIIVNPSLTLAPSGGTSMIKPVILPTDARNSVVTVSSSDEAVVSATQNTDGSVIVTGHAQGEAVVTFMSTDGSGASTQTKVTVTKIRDFDVNADGLLNESDIEQIQLNLGRSSVDADWTSYEANDVNMDNRIDATDVQLVTEKMNAYGTYSYKRVIVIGIDGLGNSVESIDTPNIHSLINGSDTQKAGAYTANGSAMYPSMSGQNWASILHGVTPDKHLITNATTTTYPENSKYPSVLKIMQQQRPATKVASFVDWGNVNNNIIEPSVFTNVGHAAGVAYKGTDAEVTKKFVDYVGSKDGEDTRFIFLHFDDVDHAGHSYGFMGTEYVKAVKTVDGQVGQLVKALKDQGMFNDSLILLTPDHGGLGANHGGNSPQEMTLSWLARGEGIIAGTIPSDVVPKNMDMTAVILHALRFDAPSNLDAVVPNHVFEVKAKKLSLLQTDFALKMGDAPVRLNGVFEPANATNRNLLWSSSNEKVAVVDAFGVVTPVGAGKATITAKSEDGGLIATAEMSIKGEEEPGTDIDVTGVVVSPTKLTIKAGNRAKLTAVVAPLTATDKAVVWSSNREDIVSVDAAGQVTGIKAGSAVITVRTVDGGFTASVALTVTKDTSGNTGGGNSKPDPKPDPTPDPKPETPVFTDVAGHWAKDSIGRLAAAGILQGLPDGSFKPNNRMTRAEYMAVLYRLLELKEGNNSSSFTDVPANAWYNSYVNRLSEEGIVKGFIDGTFRPNQSMTREEAIVLLYRAMQDKLPISNGASLVFSDNADISDWAKEAVTRLAQAGIIQGSGSGNLNPKEYITRAEIAEIIAKFMK